MSEPRDWTAVGLALSAPMVFEVLPKAVRTRLSPQGNDSAFVAQALGYIDRADVMNRLDQVLGLNGWRDEYSVLDLEKKIVECRLGLRIDGEWVYRADVGGPGEVSGSEERNAWKASYSDALKRAATHWGVGRFLYDLPKLWLPCKAQRQGEKKIRFQSWECDPLDLLLAQARNRGVAWAREWRRTGVSAPQQRVDAAPTPPPVTLPEVPPAPLAPALSPLAQLEAAMRDCGLLKRQVSAYCSAAFATDRPSRLPADQLSQLIADIRAGKVAAKAA